MKRRDDAWRQYRPCAEEANFAEVAKRRVTGLISALRWCPDMPLQTMLASAYMQGATDAIDVMLNMSEPKPRIKLKVLP